MAVEPRLATGSFDILIAAACQGAGIALLPAANCQEALFSGALVRVLPEWSGIDGMLPVVRAVIDFAAVALRSSVDP
jgi:DNA-binding transcriptional LysR family regulator